MRAYALFGIILVAGCGGAPPEAEVAEEALTTSDAISRAEQWVTAQLQYCQAAYGQVDYDQACWSMPWEKNDRCYRTSNAAWNPYRSDCSGLVSWAWGLPAPGRTTYGFYPFSKDITAPIPGTDLRAGDAINNADHVMLFKAWVTKGSRAVFIEEPGCSTTVKHAHEVTVDVSISGDQVTPAGYGMTFTAIRYQSLTVPPVPTPGPCTGVADGSYCGGDGIMGTKGTLYVCKGGKVTSSTVCKAGCKITGPGTPDECSPAPAPDGGTRGAAPDGGTEAADGGDPAAPTGPGADGNHSAPPAPGGCSMAAGPTGSTAPSWPIAGLFGAACWLARRRLLATHR